MDSLASGDTHGAFGRRFWSLDGESADARKGGAVAWCLRVDVSATSSCLDMVTGFSLIYSLQIVLISDGTVHLRGERRIFLERNAKCPAPEPLELQLFENKKTTIQVLKY
ncbi:MAG: hypothetical protein OXI13_08025 [Gammaproteobacteria bacterium]|nr:hypothetical protein [Gammaproteobacteria bacterium]